MENNAVLQSAIDKARRHLVPFILLMYMLAFLDRANIGFAKNAFQLDTGISDAAFALGAGIFFVGYALLEVPSNLLMHRYGARFWMFRIMLTWGIISAGFAFAYNETIFLILRFLLGVAEAGFFPGVIFYMTYWFPARSRGKVMGLFYFGVPLAYVVGSPLSGFLLEYMHSLWGFQGWQWMFLVEGGLAVVVSIAALFYLQDGPQDPRCHWLTPEQKAAIAAALEAEDSGKPTHSIWASMTSARVLYLCLIYFCIQIGVYGLIFYLPTQVAALMGTTVGLKVGIVTAIPWVCALVACYYIPHFSDKTGERKITAAVTLAAAGIGVAVSGFASPGIAMVALCVAAAGFISMQAIYWILPTMYLSGVAAASGIAFINSLGNLGGFLAPVLRVHIEQLTGNPASGLMFLGGVSLVGALLLVLLRDPRADKKTS